MFGLIDWGVLTDRHAAPQFANTHTDTHTPTWSNKTIFVSAFLRANGGGGIMYCAEKHAHTRERASARTTCAEQRANCMSRSTVGGEVEEKKKNILAEARLR